MHTPLVTLAGGGHISVMLRVLGVKGAGAPRRKLTDAARPYKLVTQNGNLHGR